MLLQKMHVFCNDPTSMRKPLPLTDLYSIQGIEPMTFLVRETQVEYRYQLDNG